MDQRATVYRDDKNNPCGFYSFMYLNVFFGAFIGVIIYNYNSIYDDPRGPIL